jgi:hypothetical protein
VRRIFGRLLSKKRDSNYSSSLKTLIFTS